MTTSCRTSSAQTLGQSWSPSRSPWSTCWQLNYPIFLPRSSNDILVQPQPPDTWPCSSGRNYCLVSKIQQMDPHHYLVLQDQSLTLVLLNLRVWGQVFSLLISQLFLWGPHATPALPALRPSYLFWFWNSPWLFYKALTVMLTEKEFRRKRSTT